MKTEELKEKLYELIEKTPEDKLEYVYRLLEQPDYDDNFKAMLDNELSSHQTDRNGDTREDVNSLIHDLMNTK